MQQLEQELGVNLFDRIGKRVLLSEKGRAFLSYANDMVQLEAEALETVSENNVPTGTLRIGITDTIASSFFPSLLEEYLTKYPQVHIEVVCDVTLELYEQLEKGNLDLIFQVDRSLYRPMLKIVFSRPSMIPFVASAKHPLAGKKNISPERLAEETLLFSEKSNNYRQGFDELAVDYGIIFPHLQELSTLDIILYFLEKNLGVALLPDYTLPSIMKEKNLALFTVVGFDIRMKLQILYHRQKWVTPAMKCFTELTEEFLSRPEASTT